MVKIITAKYAVIMGAIHRTLNGFLFTFPCDYNILLGCEIICSNYYINPLSMIPFKSRCRLRLFTSLL